MKKALISLLLLLSIIAYYTMPAKAINVNDFTFVAGVHFGITVDEAVQLLQDNHIEYTLYNFVENPNIPERYLVESYGIECEWMIYLHDFRIAGYQAYGYLYFRTENCLSDVEYLFSFGKNIEERDKRYEIIEDLLKQQYGETEYCSKTGKKLNKEVSHEPIRFTAKGSSAETIHTFENLEYTERLIATEDNSDILIQHHKYVENLTTDFYSGDSILIHDNNFTKVSYSLCTKDGKGYSFIPLPTVLAIEYPAEGIINSKAVKLRKSASTSSKIITTLNKDTTVTVLEEHQVDDDQVWYKLQTPKGKTGYVMSEFVSIADTQNINAAEQNPNKVKMKVQIHAECADYNNVGKKWKQFYEINGVYISDKQYEVNTAPDVPVTVYSRLKEQDNKPDIGMEKTAYVPTAEDIANGFSIRQVIEVVENSGKHKGNTATWTIEFIFTPVSESKTPSVSQMDALKSKLYDNRKSFPYLFDKNKQEEIDQAIEYNASEATFTHYISSQNFTATAYVMTMEDLTNDQRRQWGDLWESMRLNASATCVADLVDLWQAGYRDVSIVVRFATVTNPNSEKYVELYSVKYDHIKKAWQVVSDPITGDYEFRTPYQPEKEAQSTEDSISAGSATLKFKDLASWVLYRVHGDAFDSSNAKYIDPEIFSIEVLTLPEGYSKMCKFYYEGKYYEQTIDSSKVYVVVDKSCTNKYGVASRQKAVYYVDYGQFLKQVQMADMGVKNGPFSYVACCIGDDSNSGWTYALYCQTLKDNYPWTSVKLNVQYLDTIWAKRAKQLLGKKN